MLNPRIRGALVALAASAGLAACTSYGPYGGASVGVGYGSPYGYGYGYGSPYYGSYYGGIPYYGWYDGFYYPGSGYYVYDPYGYPHHWSGRQESHWSDILENARKQAGTSGVLREQWGGFSAKAATATNAEQKRNLGAIRQRIQAEQRAQVQAQASGRASVDRESVREIVRARQEARSERQSTQNQSIRERIEARRTRKPGG